MSNNFFLCIWRGREEAYSSMIAQTLLLSRKFRKFVEERLGIEKDDISIVETERYFSNSGRIDIYFEYENGLAVGIENKKWAPLQDKQLHRYAEALQKDKKDYILILLSPSQYTLPGREKPEKLVIIKYKEIVDWIKELNHKSEFEKTYFKHLLTYLEDLEMKPIQDKEIESLLFYDSCETKLKAICETKLKAILNELRKQDERIESTKNYILFGRKKNGFLFFTGFRFGTKGYYQDTLLNKSPECIIYVKDEWGDSEQQEKNILVEKIHDKLKEEPFFSDKAVKLKYYPRTKKDECRFAIRRSLSDFKDKDFDEIIPWFREAIVILEKHLTNTNSR